MRSQRLSEANLSDIRRRLINLHYSKKVGHLGGNLSSIDVIALLLNDYCEDSCQLILSKGHSALAFYVALRFVGKISEADLESALDDGTRFPGHPPFDALNETGIAFGTGSLGHGLSLALGMALAKRYRFDERLTYCVVSDGELQEGQTLEALGLAARLGLGNLIVVIDGNGLQGFGSTSDVQHGVDVMSLIGSFDLDLKTRNGHELNEIREAIDLRDSSKPLVLWLKTVKGNGVPGIEGKLSSHYWPLTDKQYAQMFNEVI